LRDIYADRFNPFLIALLFFFYQACKKIKCPLSILFDFALFSLSCLKINIMEEQKDEKLWRLAKQRARFQESLLGFMFISGICWVIWYITAGRRGHNTEMPWPVWVMLGLGIALFLKFIRAYKIDRDTLTEREYQKLKKEDK
jgi:2TM domain